MLMTDFTKSVVVPFDFSELSIEALRRTLEMVNDPSRVKVIYVSQYPSVNEYGVIWDTVTPETIMQNLHSAFQDELENVEGSSKVDFRVIFGSPGPEIASFAEEEQAELIVMPSHGRSGFSHFLLGSVAEKVLRLASCPVLVLKDLQGNALPTNKSKSANLVAI